MTVVLAHTPNVSAEAAFDAAVQQAVYRQSDLVVVNAARGDALVEDQRASTEHLDALVAHAEAKGLRVVVERPLDADVTHAVLQLVRQHQAAILVIGIRHRSAVGKLLLGSVAQRLLLEVDCQVLAVKPRH